jgi:hypothetical protein
MGILHPDLDLAHPLQALTEADAAFIPRALSEPFRGHLQDELEAGPFERLPDEIGPVRQEADLFIITGDMAHHPAVARLRPRFVTRVRRDGSQLPGLAREVAQ